MAKGRLSLSDDWRAWAVENLLAGVEPNRLVTTLVEREIPSAVARREVLALARSPSLDACRRLKRRASQLELIAALSRTHARLAAAPGEIERRPTIAGDEFFSRYFAASQPLVLTEALRGWPALKWTPAGFKRRFGRVRVRVTSGREQDPYYDQNFAKHSVTVTLGAFIDRVLAAGTTNDFYMVSNNRTMDRVPFRALLKDLRPPADIFDPARIGGATSLWIGPAGTVTPLHHDTTNILFCQMFGEKRVELVSPHETALLGSAHGFYSPVDLDRRSESPDVGIRELLVRQVVLRPGDALFIPAGWWHRVRSLSVSISLSLLHFRRPNDLSWYKPGH